MILPRSSGILLHPTSFSGPYGIGDLGGEAEEFIDFLVRSGQRFWQVLPLGPTGYGDSPYQSYSSFAGNPLLISPEGLLQDGLLDQEDLEQRPAFPEDRVDYGRVIHWKTGLLKRAFENYCSTQPAEIKDDFVRFCESEARWLDDFALFMALKEANHFALWTDWDSNLVSRDPEALREARETFGQLIEAYKFTQFLYARQWGALHERARNEGILIIGDIPIYAAHDSADVWGNQAFFKLDERGNPLSVAGVPPDYFSETGQLWGNPTYRWDVLRDHGFSWWIERVAATLKQVDVIRIDHFRGFEAYWEVPAGEPTAVKGKWVEGPRDALFTAIQDALGGRGLPIIAENLGVITPEVEALRERFDLPGMAVFQFGFGDHAKTSPFPPHKYTRRLVAYTGTHDNDTLMGWWQDLASSKSGRKVRRYVNRYLNMRDREFNWKCIRTLMASVADLVIFPVQDILGLGKDGRMNRPGVSSGNWAWRMSPNCLTEELSGRLLEMVELYGRDEPYSESEM